MGQGGHEVAQAVLLHHRLRSTTTTTTTTTSTTRLNPGGGRAEQPPVPQEEGTSLPASLPACLPPRLPAYLWSQQPALWRLGVHGDVEEHHLLLDPPPDQAHDDDEAMPPHSLTTARSVPAPLPEECVSAAAAGRLSDLVVVGGGHEVDGRLCLLLP